MRGVVLVQMFEGERRAGTVAQQPLPSGPIGAFDAHRGVEREATAVRPAAHLVAIVLLEQAAADLDYVTGSRAASAALAENYVGLPME